MATAWPRLLRGFLVVPYVNNQAPLPANKPETNNSQWYNELQGANMVVQWKNIT